MEMCFSRNYFKLICILIFPAISLTSDLFREDTFTWVGTASVESSDLVIKEISFTRITSLWCINQCKKFPGCHGIEFCNSGKSLCRLWNGPFDQQMAANGTHLAECNRFSKDTVLTSGMMTESVTMISTDLMPLIDTITGAIVTTLGTTSPLKDTITSLLTTSKEDTATSGESITTKDNTIQIDFTTADTNPPVYSTQDDTISISSTTVDVTSLVDSTTTNAITTINSNIDDSTAKITLTTFGHKTSIISSTIDFSTVVTTASVDSTTNDATTNIHLASLETSTSIDLTTVDVSTSIDSNTVDASTLIDSTKVDATTVDTTTVDATTVVDKTTVDSTSSVDSTTVDATTSVDSTTFDATTDSTAADTTTAIDTTTGSYCPDCECWMTQGLSGALPIYLNGQLKEVNCENSSTYSWTVFQRRFDGTESFDRTWLEYEEGFGSAAGEFWLGNAYTHALTMLGYTHLKIEVMTFDTIVHSIEYPNFQIGDSTENYMLRSLGTPIITSADMDDSLEDGVSRAFSTPDMDNDNSKAKNCALNLKSGWWFNNCADANLNGEYSHIEDVSDRIYWFGFGWHISMKETTMKIRKP